MLKKTSIIIPTKNRKNFVLRTLNYYLEKKINFNVYVVDSSEIPLDKNIISKYYFLKYFHKKLKTQEAILYALNFVDTEYCIYQGDDDIFIPDNLKDFETILDNDKEISAVGGKIIGINIENDDYKGKISHLSEYKTDQVLNNNKFFRLKYFCKNYFVCLFYLSRTKHIKKAYEISSSVEIPEVNGEICQVFFLALSGKIKLIDDKLFMVRQILESHTKLYGLMHYLLKDIKFLDQMNKLYINFYNSDKRNDDYDLNKYLNYLNNIFSRFALLEYFGKDSIKFDNIIFNSFFNEFNKLKIFNNRYIQRLSFKFLKILDKKFKKVNNNSIDFLIKGKSFKDYLNYNQIKYE